MGAGAEAALSRSRPQLNLLRAKAGNKNKSREAVRPCQKANSLPVSGKAITPGASVQTQPYAEGVPKMFSLDQRLF